MEHNAENSRKNEVYRKNYKTQNQAGAPAVSKNLNFTRNMNDLRYGGTGSFRD